MAIKIISETPIAMAELKDDLKKIKERDSELNFRAQKTEDYLNMFVGLTKSQADELIGKIEGLKIPRFKPEHIAKIVDVLPTSLEEAKIVLSAYPITITNDNLKKIVDAVIPYTEISKKEVKKQEAVLEKKRKEEEKAAEETAKAEAEKAAEEEKKEAEKEEEAPKKEEKKEEPSEEKEETVEEPSEEKPEEEKKEESE